MVHAVAHIHGDDFPRLKAQITLLQQGLQFRTRYCFDGGGDCLLQIHQLVNITVDFSLQVYNLTNSIGHLGCGLVGITRHTRQHRTGAGSKVIQSLNLLNLGIDTHIQKLGLH